MIAYFSVIGSRLGNHLFKLAALDYLCDGRKVGILFGATGIHECFHWKRRNVVVVERRPQRVLKILQKGSRLGLVSHFAESQFQSEFGYSHTGDLVRLNNSWSPLSLVEDSFLQSDRWLRSDFKEMLVFREAVVESVKAFGVERNIDWRRTIFVHVRRGDYVGLDVLGAGPPTLPPDYYRQGIERLRDVICVDNVLFVSDDAEFVEREFADVRRKIVVSGSSAFDLCLMAMCASGVLSASSFSWWGAMLGPLSAPPVVPKYWMGWKRGVDSPLSIISKHFDAVIVDAGASERFSRGCTNADH